ncbi:chemosensory receptor a [Plakobranchus ocellatus]|uniref:Chemosensory receptor a n=1 Tax=Plakobranchus ocellatus TaxID=259542 RepID=A0AAV4D5N4_9GAST|nr:chemosensory receptor a [Plakobranchus ocellatus]
MHGPEFRETSSHAFLPTAEDPLKTWIDEAKNPSSGTVASGLLNDEQFDIICLVLISVLQLINITGVVTNSLNIAVFVRLGLAEPSNISLLALAVCDLTCMVLSMWTNLCYLPPFRDSPLPFHPTNVTLLAGGGLYSFMVRTVAWITAFITFERCLCILVPLKVKRLITPRTTTTAMLVIGTLTVLPYLLTYTRYKFEWVFSPNVNATILDVVHIDTNIAILLEKVVMTICGVIQPMLAFVIVIVCTIFLVVRLKRVSSWRASVTTGNLNLREDMSGESAAPSKVSAKSSVSSKEQLLVKMVVAIATIFIICFIPTFIMLLLAALFDEFFMFGIYKRIFITNGLITFLGQSLSGTVNIIIYYTMASKYRACLRCLLRLDHQG